MSEQPTNEQEQVSPYSTTIRYRGVEATIRAYSTEPHLRWTSEDPDVEMTLNFALHDAIEEHGLGSSEPHPTYTAAELTIAELGEGEIISDVTPPAEPLGPIWY